MTPQEIATLDGGINGALFVDNPQSPTPSVGASADTGGDRPPSEFEQPSQFQGDRYLGRRPDQPITMGDVGDPTIAAGLPRTPLEALDAGATAVEGQISRSNQGFGDDVAASGDYLRAVQHGGTATPEQEARAWEAPQNLAMSLSGEPLAAVGTAGRAALGIERAASATRQGGMSLEEALPPLSSITDNYRKPLSAYTSRVFHETDAGRADEFLPVPGGFGRTETETYLATSPDLALGQGGKRGVLLEFDAAPIQGQVNTRKPTWQPLWESGDAEFIARHNEGRAYQDALRSVTVTPEIAGTPGERMRLKRNLAHLERAGWEQTTNADGSTTYTRPAAPSETRQPGMSLMPAGGAAARAGEAGSAAVGPAISAAGLLGGGAAGYATAPAQRPDEPDAAYAARVFAQTAAGGAVGLAGAIGAQQLAQRLNLPARVVEEATVAPSSSAGFGQFWNRARNVIAQQGEAGQQLAQRLRDWRDGAETLAGSWTSAMPTVRKLSPDEFRQFVAAAEGKIEPTSPLVTQAVAEWDGVRSDVYQRAQQAGLDIGKQEDYFPHVFEEGTFSGKGFSQAIDHLVQSGQAESRADAAQTLRYAQDVRRNRRYSNLETERSLDLPFYRRDKGVLFGQGGYLEAAANRIAQVATFGEKDVGALHLIDRIGQQGGDAGAAKALYDISVGATKYGTEQRAWSARLRRLNTVSQLGLSAITNVGQSANTATVAGFGPTARNVVRALRDPAAKEYAVRAGVTLDNVVQDVREGTGMAATAGRVINAATAPFFSTVERFNRTLALHAGVDYAQSMAAKAAEGDAGAAKALDRLGLDGAAVAERGVLTEAEKIAAGRAMVERTQFKVDPQDLPGWASSPWGKVVAQFKSFSYNQSAFLGREVIQPALRGDLAPMTRFMIAGLAAGAFTTEARNALQARQPEQDWTKRVLQYYQAAGGLGLAGDVLRVTSPILNINADRVDPERLVTQAVGTALGPTAGAGIEALSGVAQATRGNPTSLERSALRRIPVVGTTLQNLLVPYAARPAPAAPGGGATRSTTGSPKPPAAPKPPAPPRPPKR
jgi:hypothetical protein